MTPLGTNPQVIINNTGSMKSPYKTQNGTAKSLETVKLMETGKSMYKLMIQIDKITTKPGPRSKKLALLEAVKNQQIADITENIRLKRKESSTTQKKTDIMLKSPLNKPKQICENIVPKPNFIDKIVHCHDCGAPFPIKMRFGCQICEIPCGNNLLCSVHEKLRGNSDSKLQLKCDNCRLGVAKKKVDSKVQLMVYPFVSKADGIMQVEETRKSVNPIEKSFRDNSLSQPTRTEDQTTSPLYGEGSKKNDRKSIPIVTENIEIEEENSIKKCNICNKFFITEEKLNQHLALHLSQAHHCTVCRKVFINRTTLQVHMRSHEN